MKKTIYFDENCGYVVAALTENGKLTRFDFERDDSRPVKGNIYKGRVIKVLPGMQAAFVDCGLERSCYLTNCDAAQSAEAYDGSFEDIRLPELKEGDSVLVQAVKPPIDKKGAKVSLLLSFVGKNVIYLPNTPYIGVSRKIGDDELKKNLAYSVRNLVGDGEGIVLRTAAPYARRDRLETELEGLKNVYKGVLENFERAETGALLYCEGGLVARILRDTLSSDIEEIIIGTERLKTATETFYTMFQPARKPSVRLNDSDGDLFEASGISGQVAGMLERRAELENGAHIVIDRCEALTAIDVNTGAFTGNSSLEETVYYTNMLATREIARQIKLRNIGGIVVVDFIDMTDDAHGRNVVKELKDALSSHGLKCVVGQMSEFGLVELTVKRESADMLHLLKKPSSRPSVKAQRFILFETRVKLMNLYSEGTRRVLLDVSADTLSLIKNWSEFSGSLKSSMPDLSVFLQPHRSYDNEQIRIRCTFEPDANTVKLY